MIITYSRGIHHVMLRMLMEGESAAFVAFLWTDHLRCVDRVMLHHRILDFLRDNYLLRLFYLPSF
jgi:hypothetical protein